MYCQNCGSQAADDQAFCQNCGTSLLEQGRPTTQVRPAPQAPPYVMQAPPYYPQTSAPKPVLGPVTLHSAAQVRRKPKSQTPAVAAIIAAGLAVILLFEFLIGPLISGRTIWGEPFRLGKSPAASSSTVMVSPDEPVAEIEGVRVDFGDNLAGEVEFSLTKSSTISESALYTGIDNYDFSLSGQSEFSTLVDITIPNTAAAEEAVKVAYYNEDQEVWESLPFEIADDEIKFSTTHFSRFGLIKYHRDRYAGPLTPLVVNFTQLRKAMAGLEEDGLFEQFIAQKGQTGSDPWINKGLSVFNDAVGTVSVPVTYEAMVAGAGDTAARELSDKLTKVGGAVTFLKIAYQWQAGDQPTKILQDNVFDLCELILGGAALAMPGSVVLPVAGVLVFLSGAFYEYIFVPAYQDDSLQYAFKAYSDFCNLPLIAYDSKLAQALAEGNSEESPWVVAEKYDAKTKKWESSRRGLAITELELGTNKKWQDALMDIYKLYQKDPKAMQERVDALIEEYLDAFWFLDGPEQIQFAKDYSGISEADWRWPTESEISQMKESMKAELMRNLKPVFEEVQRTIIEEMKNSLQKDTEDLVLYLNQELTFEVLDPDAEEPGIKNSRVADDFIRFESVANPAHKDDWISQPEKRSGETVFATTLYNYLKEGSPDKVSFYKTEADLNSENAYMTIDLQVELPLTTILLAQKDGIPGTYTTTWDRAVGMDSDTMALWQCLLTQFKDITVAKDGRIDARAPAQAITFMAALPHDEFAVNASFGAAEMNGQIDLVTGKGRVYVSGSMEAQSQMGEALRTWSISFSGDMSVNCSNGTLMLYSSPDNLSVHVTGRDITKDSDGSTLADFNVDTLLKDQFVFRKAQ